MNRFKKVAYGLLAFAIFVSLSAMDSRADDTCMFSVTADDVPPNIVILLDNGAEMQQVQWHGLYDNSVDYAPIPTGLAVNGLDDDGDGTIDEDDEDDFVKTGGSGGGFFNSNGYGLVEQGGSYYLVAIKDNLEPAGYSEGIEASSSNGGDGTGIWTINGHTVTLPAEASAALDGDGIKDNAGLLRYSKNYLNWIFFSGIYTGDGSDLKAQSRFYNAKKAILNVGKLTSNQARFGIYSFTSVEGSSSVQPLSMVVNTVNTLPENNILDPNFINNINNMGTVTYSPLAEGLATIGGYYDSPSSQVVSYYCQKNFVIVVSPGISSMDTHPANQYLPTTFEDFDGDAGGIGEGNIKADASTHSIPMNANGSAYLDDVAHYMYTHDMVGYQTGFQNVITYTVGFMGDLANNLFLINTSNNGNGNTNLYTTSHPDYGKYHFSAESPDDMTTVLLEAVNTILSQNMTYTAPVVPVTKTMSGSKIYLAFFKPLEGNFWEGNIVKLGMNADLDVIGSDGLPATWPNGAMRDDAKYYWSTKKWADISAANGIANGSRQIYTYLGGNKNLSADPPTNFFTSGNGDLTAAVLGNPTHTTAEIINYIRGADVFDEDANLNITENREVITGDVLHSQPLVVHYVNQYDSCTSMVFFGSNDGMLHAVLDSIDPDINDPGNVISHFGTEAWAFISPDHLPRLKDIVEGTGHQYFMDASPQAFIRDVNENGIMEDSVDSDGDGDIDDDDKDWVIIICGQRKGGTSYFALDVTDPLNPAFLWRISADDTFAPDVVISELGESWSEPRFGRVKTSDGDTTGTDVFFIGGGFSSDNTAGMAVMAIDVFTGAVVKKFVNDSFYNTDMNYSIPGTVSVIDENNNGFVDKLYAGDLGGQVWRIGQFDQDASAMTLVFPNSDENINSWNGHVLFQAPTYEYNSVTTPRKFFYAPSVTLEQGYDLVLIGSGDREMACANDTAADRIYSMKDTHAYVTLTESDLVDVTNPLTIPPDLDNPGDVDENGTADKGWYVRLVDSGGAEIGEKSLAKGTVFYKVLYITTFVPTTDPCLPGGAATLYAMDYKTGAAVLSFGGVDLVRNKMLGGGIPSNPVPVVTATGQKLLVSVGSTNPLVGSESVEAGILGIDPLAPDLNFYYMWWREL
jgi:type IV pilus assembly protein PilY1